MYMMLYFIPTKQSAWLITEIQHGKNPFPASLHRRHAIFNKP